MPTAVVDASESSVSSSYVTTGTAVPIPFNPPVRPENDADPSPLPADLPVEGMAAISLDGTHAAGPGAPGSEIVVLTPSRLRVDSRVVFSHSTIQWLTNCVFAICILMKLNKRWDVSWWIIFIPTWVNHGLHIPLQILVLAAVNHLIYKQIGPPPPATATAGLHLQYSLLRRTRSRSHIVDGINSLLETVAMLIVKILFCWNLQQVEHGAPWVSLRLIFTPFWFTWVATALLSCAKDRSERMFGSTRDLLYIFFLFVAFKVDGQSSYTWRIVFIMPWMWFAALFLLATMVLVLLLFARVWGRLQELLLPLGFFCLLASTVPQFVSFVYLVQRLDSGGGEQPSGITFQDILVPNAVSWFLMWLSSCMLAVGLRQKELVREALLRSGAVWTAHEHIARRLHTEREAAQRKIDQLTEGEIAKLVEEMMAGKTKPLQLMRVGATLYKRVTSFDNGTSRIPSNIPGAPTASVAVSVEATGDKHLETVEELKLNKEFEGDEAEHIKAVREPTALVTAGAQGGGAAESHEINIPGSATASQLDSDSHLGSLPGSRRSSLGGSRRQSAHQDADRPPPDATSQELKRDVSRRLTATSPRQGPAAQVELIPLEPVEQRPVIRRAAPANLEVHAEAELDTEDLSPTPGATTKAELETAEDNLCIICYENPFSCVFLECGHGGFCRRCAWRLFVRPPNECPTCRQRIEQVVEIAEEARVGQPVKVRV